MTVDDFYPIGSLYETSDDNFDPNISFGGTWSVVSDGCVTVSDPNGTSSTSIGTLVGADTVTLTEAQMPQHSHTINLKTITNDGNTTASTATYGNTKRTSYIYGFYNNPSGPNCWGYGTTTWKNTGSGNAHNNMQPYIGVKRWRRTA